MTADLKVIRPFTVTAQVRRRPAASVAKPASSTRRVAQAPAPDDTPGAVRTGTTDRIVASITAAIVERRLMPGTKLAEQQIADIFSVSRTLVRQALNQLSRDHLVTLEPARGAFVAQPSVEEARQVFEVRNMLEAAMIKRAATELTPQHINQLRAHLQAEKSAVQRTDVPGRTRLLADFHVLLAQMLGNQALAEILQDLVSRCSLIALMYQSAHSAGHSYEEHVAIVDALERCDTKGAVKLMQDHLHHVEQNLRLDPRIPDLHAALRPGA